MIGFSDVTVIGGGNAKAVDMGEMGMGAFVARFQDAIEALAA